MGTGGSVRASFEARKSFEVQFLFEKCLLATSVISTK